MSLKPEPEYKEPEMKSKILNIFITLLAMAAISSCSKEMPGKADHVNTNGDGLRSITITGAVTDAQSGKPLEDITIHFKAYPQDTPDASPLIIDEVHTTSNGTYTVHASGLLYEPLLCVLTAQDVKDVYESKTNQVIISWSGMSYDKESGQFVVNDCTFQLNKKSE